MLLQSDLVNDCLQQLQPCPTLSWPHVTLQATIADADLQHWPAFITQITGALNLDNSANSPTFITSVAPFSALTSLGGLLIVAAFVCPLLFAFLLQNNWSSLTSVGSLDALTTITDSLIIENNPALTSITGFQSLTFVDGNLTVQVSAFVGPDVLH